MNNKERLLELVENTEFTQELKTKITKYFTDQFDSMIALKKFKGLLNGDLEHITDDETSDIINMLGGQIQVEQEDESVKENQDENVNVTIPTNIMDSHNNLVMENQKLKNELDEKEKTIDKLSTQVDETTKKLDEMLDKFSKFERMFETLKKYNITEIGKFVEVDDEIVNEAYLGYTTEGKTEYENTYIIVKDDTVNVVKSYFKLEKK